MQNNEQQITDTFKEFVKKFDPLIKDMTRDEAIVFLQRNWIKSFNEQIKVLGLPESILRVSSSSTCMFLEIRRLYKEIENLEKQHLTKSE